MAFLMSYDDKLKLDFMLEKPALILKETFYTSQAGFAFLPNYFMFDLIDEVIERLLTTGTFQFLWKNYYHQLKVQVSFSSEELKNLDSSRNKLTIDDLEYGFVIWMISIAVAVGAFLLEVLLLQFLKKILWFWNKLMQKFLGNVLVSINVRNLINIRRY
jgi:hypothetical protein